MKRHELRFLLGVHDDIDKACLILGVTRAEFMANMTRFIDTVSLGIEMGREMRGKPAKVAAAVIGKPSPNGSSKNGNGRKGKKAAKKAAKASAKAAGGPTLVQKLVKVMGRRTMSLADIESALKKAKQAPPSKNLRAYLSAVLTSVKDNNGKRVFMSPGRGMHFVAAKQSAREIARKKKTAAKAAKKVAAKKVAKSKANGKAEPSTVAASTLN